jgi:hypothetical protein
VSEVARNMAPSGMCGFSSNFLNVPFFWRLPVGRTRRREQTESQAPVAVDVSTGGSLRQQRTDYSLGRNNVYSGAAGTVV